MSVERDSAEIVQVRDGGTIKEMPRWYFEAHRLPSWQIVKQLELTELDVPGRNIPAGMWIHVLNVLAFYGVEAEPVALISALYDVVNKTPIDKGGRLRPDGTVDRDLDLKDDRDDSSRRLTVAAEPPTSATRLLEDSASSCMYAESWVVRGVWCNASPTYYGPFPSSVEAGAWAKRRLDGDIACIGYEVEQLLGEGDAPSEIVESLTRAGLVD